MKSSDIMYDIFAFLIITLHHRCWSVVRDLSRVNSCSARHSARRSRLSVLKLFTSIAVIYFLSGKELFRNRFTQGQSVRTDKVVGKKS